jgi:uncharacterized protein (DUF2252 family)
MSTHRASNKHKGKSQRRQTPRSSHGVWQPAPDRPDPIDLLQQQDEGRLQHLIPIKYGRMLGSPFAFFRGSAGVMAADLASTPVTGFTAMLCGDAHLCNFGLFATPERNLVFDINDFDEAYVGHWEWDLKRLATSVVVAARENGFSDKRCRSLAEAAARAYAKVVESFSQASTLEMWYYQVDAQKVQRLFDSASSKQGRRRSKATIAKARTRTQNRTLEQLTETLDGKRRIISNPPLLVPFREYKPETETVDAKNFKSDIQDATQGAWQQYLDSLSDERRFLLQRYQIVDGALRVGGIGSVGTRCMILLLEGRNQDDAIILQLKEAGTSVLEPYTTIKDERSPAERVVAAQRLIQASSDMFLGWHSGDRSFRNFYWRQLKDMKGSVDIEKLDEKSLATYSKLCAACLAHAHARTGDSTAIAGYLGGGVAFAEAIGRFAVAYADQADKDHQALVAAVKSGRIIAETGI